MIDAEHRKVWIFMIRKTWKSFEKTFFHPDFWTFRRPCLNFHESPISKNKNGYIQYNHIFENTKSQETERRRD